MFLSDKPKFFGRRKGRTIRKAKSTLLEAFLPTIKITPETNFNKQTLFARPVEKVFLEIGFGNGEHLAGQALNNPETGFIGAEVFQNGVANLLTLITGIKEGDNLPEKITLLPGRNDNIRVWDDDVRLLFSKIPDNFVDKVFVLFPAPWPKKRHASRRFAWTAKCGNDWKHEPSDWVQTKYQRKAIREGRRPVFLDYKRV